MGSWLSNITQYTSECRSGLCLAEYTLEQTAVYYWSTQCVFPWFAQGLLHWYAAVDRYLGGDPLGIEWRLSRNIEDVQVVSRAFDYCYPAYLFAVILVFLPRHHACGAHH